MPSLALPPHVHMVRAKGREYYYFQMFRGTKRQGLGVKLPGCPRRPDGTPDPTWWQAYRAASGAPAPAVRAGTFAALALEWAGVRGCGSASEAHEKEQGKPASVEWRRLAPNTQRNYRTALARILAAWGELPVRACQPGDILDLRDAFEDMPAAANTMLTALSSMLAWSIPRRYREDNPAAHVKPFPPGDPWAAWPVAAIEAWRALAVPELRRVMMVALYTGQRASDLIKMTWRHVDAGVIQVIQEKTNKPAWIPLHRDLRAELERGERRSTHILVGERGRPLKLEGLKTLWQRQHDAIELVTGDCHGLVLHGLRKSAVCFLLEAGCSEEEVEAITRQSRDMIRHYAQDMNRQRLAERAIAKWEKGGG